MLGDNYDFQNDLANHPMTRKCGVGYKRYACETCSECNKRYTPLCKHTAYKDFDSCNDFELKKNE